MITSDRVERKTHQLSSENPVLDRVSSALLIYVSLASLTQTEQELQDSLPSTVLPSPELSLLEIDYSSYPHRTSSDIKAKQNKADQCKEKMLSCHTSERLAQFKSEGGFSETEIKWVYHRLLTSAEQAQIIEAASLSQLSLFKQVDHNWDKLITAIDAEISRLGWTTTQAKEYLLAKYNKRSRQLLDNEEIIEFWQYLRKM